MQLSLWVFLIAVTSDHNCHNVHVHVCTFRSLIRVLTGVHKVSPHHMMGTRLHMMQLQGCVASVI